MHCRAEIPPAGEQDLEPQLYADAVGLLPVEWGFGRGLDAEPLGDDELFRTISPACPRFNIRNLVEPALQLGLQTLFSAACQNLGHEGAAGTENIKGQFCGGFAQGYDPQVIGLFVTR